MPISIIDNFQVNKLAPIDNRMVATSSSSREAIQYKYDGLKVFQTDDRQTYIWSASASSWSVDLGGSISGTGSSGFISRWSGSSSIMNSIVYNNQTGTLSGYQVGLIGINTPPSGTLAVKEAFQVNAPYSGGEAPPFVISKGSVTTIGENWYYTSSEQIFTSLKGSSIIQFDNGSISFKSRVASAPSTTSEKVRIESSGELSPLYGIKFPATQSISVDANTLDDYEEGLISISSFINLSSTSSNTLFGAAGGTSSGSIGYVKVGTSVTISGSMTLNWSGVNGGTYGARYVQLSLPFTPSNGIGVHLVCPQWTENSSSPYGGTICIQSSSGNPVALKYHKSGSAVSETTVTNFKNLNSGICDIFITFSYISNQ